jgi:precorrin-6A synthase
VCCQWRGRAGSIAGVRTVHVIGIGTGDPDHVTVQAIRALSEVAVVFVVDKGEATADLVAVRTEICARHAKGRWRLVTIDDPPRDRTPADYGAAVAAWHAARAAAWGRAITTELADGEAGAFLVWGDPSLYDSTIRILDAALEAAAPAVPFAYEVVPGISSVQVLAARHRIPLNRVGEPVRITTGRRLAEDPRVDEDVVVVLDGQQAFRSVDGDVRIWWGAYLGTSEEILVAGRVADVADEIARRRAEARARLGWVMDVYLLRRPPG